jgi:hypothetical protein
MRALLLAAALLAPLAASAQQPTPAQQQQGLGATVMQLTQQLVAANVQIAVLQAEIEALKAQKPAADPSK